MQYSTNLNMNKPERADQYNLDHWNQNTDILDSAIQAEINARESTDSNLSSHVNDTNNPHEVTKAQVGLSEVENTKLSEWSGSSNLTTCSKGTFGDASVKNIASDITDSDLNLPTAKLIHKNIQKFTYIVNNDASLEYWLTDGASGASSGGNDFTSVLIKKGTWNFSGTSVALNNRTKVIVGEVGNLIDFNYGSNSGIWYNNGIQAGVPEYLLSEECYIFNVNIKNATYGFQGCLNLINCSCYNCRIGFARCKNLINCKVCKTNVYGSGNQIGFVNCENLINCYYKCDGSDIAFGYAFSNCEQLSNCEICDANVKSLICFNECKRLSNCKLKINTTNNNGLGFDQCEFLNSCSSEISTSGANTTTWSFRNSKNIMNCYARAINSGTSGKGYGFHSCTGVINCFVSSATTTKYYQSYSVKDSSSSTYACAGTANGGFNT